MKWIKLILAASLMPLYAGPVKAEEPASYGLLLDFNGDGTTDEKDWNAIPEWALSYNPYPDKPDPLYASQELPATINLLLDATVQSMPASGTGEDLSSVKEFYLIDGYSTPARCQESLGTCWAFSALSSIESSLLFRKKGKPVLSEHAELKFNAEDDSVNLSRLYLALEGRSLISSGSQKSEGTTVKDPTPLNILNSGAFTYDAQVVLTSWDGPLTEKQEPYEPISNEDGAAVYGYHNEAEDRASIPEAHVQTVLYLDTPVKYHADLERKEYVYDGYDPDATSRMKQALTEYGAIALSYKALLDYPVQEDPKASFNYDNYAQYTEFSDLDMNHAVTVVGWNDNFSRENFRTETGIVPEGDGAWLVKNSWYSYNASKELYGDMLDEILEEEKGSPDKGRFDQLFNYGIKDEEGHGTGYFWLSYYDHSIVSITAFDAESAETGYSYDNLYQYDLYRIPAFRPLVFPAEGTGIRTANFFTSEKDETLRAVGVYSPVSQADAAVEVYILPDGSNDLSKAALAGTASMKLDRGYHTIPLQTAVGLPAGTRFAVSAAITSSDGTREYSWLALETGLKESLQTDENMHKTTSHMVCNEGETLFSCDGGTSWETPAALNADPLIGQSFEFGNALIKAYTTDHIDAAPAELSTPEAPAASSPTQDSSSASGSAGILVLVLCGLSAAMIWYFLCRD